MTLDQQTGEFSERWWPNKPMSTMFTGNSDDNQLPHSSVMMRTSACLKAGNYQERAIGLGADDYNLWFRLYNSGAKIVRDDAVRNVAYRIHEKNSLKIRRARYGHGGNKGKVAAAAAAAGLAALASPRGASAASAVPPAPPALQTQHVVHEGAKPQREKKTSPHDDRHGPLDMALNPPHS
jgi:hypothetical protein